MPSTFLAADYHFSHKNIINFGRPFATLEEHDETLVQNHNKVVKPSDTVIIAGDVVFPQTGFEYLKRLNGIKTLLMGNHERHKLDRYLGIFKNIRTEKLFKDIIVTHLPLHPGQYTRFGTLVHGHTHMGKIMLGDRPDPRYLCISMEQTGYFPITLEEVRDRINRNLYASKQYAEERFGVDFTIGGEGHGPG